MILEILCHETTEIIDQLLFSQTSPERDFLTHFHIIVVNIHVKNPQVTYNPLPQKPITPIPLKLILYQFDKMIENAQYHYYPLYYSKNDPSRKNEIPDQNDVRNLIHPHVVHVV